MTDPRMKKERGRYVCAGCGTVLNEVTVKYADPFCSVSCANRYWGVEIATNPTKRGTPVGSSS